MWTMAKGQKVYLIGFLDDYSRYIVGWGLFAAQGSSQVLEVLRNAIAQYGNPKEILSDQDRQFYAWRGKCPFQKKPAREVEGPQRENKKLWLYVKVRRELVGIEDRGKKGGRGAKASGRRGETDDR